MIFSTTTFRATNIEFQNHIHFYTYNGIGIYITNIVACIYISIKIEKCKFNIEFTYTLCLSVTKINNNFNY